MIKKTALYDIHKNLGGKMVPFAGFYLPVQYREGVIKEHMAVRKACGIFDVSHMGEFVFRGVDAGAALNMILTNDLKGMTAGRVRYSPMCNERGGIVDDLIVYKKNDLEFLVVVNAANKEKDHEWMNARVFGDCELEDISDRIGQIALQGPLSREIIAKLTEESDLPEKYYTFTENVIIAGTPCLVSRTGYTGSFGYEIYMDAERSTDVWNAIMRAGEGTGLLPCGLGARDTLRLEAAMPLYGHELTEETTPFEAGLSSFVKMEKDNFIGKEALLNKKDPERVRVGLKVIGRGIIRERQDVYIGGSMIGVTTSGTMSPMLKKGVAMALLDAAYSEIGTSVRVDVRGRSVDAEVTAMPFVK